MEIKLKPNLVFFLKIFRLMILGNGIQRIIYFCYRNKKIAEKWFEENMKPVIEGVEVYFLEYKDIKKENPEDFLLDDNIDI